MFASEDGVSADTAQEVLQETLAGGDCCDVLFRLRLALDSIVGDALLGRDRRND